jgi:hypothetical protein
MLTQKGQFLNDVLYTVPHPFLHTLTALEEIYPRYINSLYHYRMWLMDATKEGLLTDKERLRLEGYGRNVNDYGVQRAKLANHDEYVSNTIIGKQILYEF